MKTVKAISISSIFVAIIFATSSAAYSQARLTGIWDGQDWGVVTITAKGTGFTGTYTSTYGTGAGTFMFTADPKKAGQFVGTWSESKKRGGTLVLVPNAANTSFNISWKANANVQVGGTGGSTSIWTKNPHKWQAIAAFPFPYGTERLSNAAVLKATDMVGTAIIGAVAPSAAVALKAFKEGLSIGKAKEVFVVYGCVDQKTNRITRFYKEAVHISEPDSISWWAKDDMQSRANILTRVAGNVQRWDPCS